MADFRYEIVAHLGIMSTNDEGWTREVNLVSYNGAPAKYDVRYWSPDHSRMSKGITLTEEEAEAMSAMIANYLLKTKYVDLDKEKNDAEDVFPADESEEECAITNIFDRKPQAVPVAAKTAPAKKETQKKPAKKKASNMFDGIELPFK